jgi:hypothetical protein
MNRDSLLAEASAADREADAHFAKIEAARGRNGPLIPAGFEAVAQKASGLRRQANALRSEADEVALVVATSPAPAPAAKAPAPSPAKPAAPVETAESVAARILASDSTVAGKRASLSAPPAAADPVEAVAARILAA